MMLRYALNQPEAANKIEQAVVEVLDRGYRTGDIMSEGMKLVGCRAMGDALIEVLQGWSIYLVGAGFTNNIRRTHTIS